MAKIPHFWSLVFEQAPPEIDNFIQPSDSKVFADCFDTFEVSRFELDDPKGSPRSFSLKFGFKENEYFEDEVLEKKFWFRRTKDWAGLVSEPVKIRWKKDKDLTSGLTDAACKLGEERKKLSVNTSDAEARKKETKSAAYKELAQKIETTTDASVSFFGLFAFVSGYRWVNAEESEQATNEEREKVEKIKRGEKVEEDEEDEDDAVDYQEIEVFPGGDEIATIIAEDMWPNAIKYYSMLPTSFPNRRSDLTFYVEATFDEDDGDDDDDDDIEISDAMADSDDNSDQEEVDIRALVGKGRNSGDSPPAKKQRKA